MIFDFTIAASVHNLNEYYSKLYDLHATAHKPEYMMVHHEIQQRIIDCESYTELGVNQGATLAAAMIENPKKVRAYDIKLGPYNHAKHLFEQYAVDNSIDYGILECDTLACTLDPVDMLYIDTLHRYDHLTKELALHGDKANKYIIFHDTAAQAGLKQAVEEFVNKNDHWNIIADCKINVGFMTIKRN